MKRYQVMQLYRLMVMMCVWSFFVGCGSRNQTGSGSHSTDKIVDLENNMEVEIEDDSSGQEVNYEIEEEQIQETPLPPYEVYFLDSKSRPQDNGVAGRSYTANVYILDNVKKEVKGPYRGSSFPNSFSNSNNATPYNTVEVDIHLFNNLYGHKGSTVKGLNLIDDYGHRHCKGYAPSGADVTMTYVNIHSGVSNRGNFNSRGSHGCLTLLPADAHSFFSHFDFKFGTTGTSKGVVNVIRAPLNDLNTIEDDIKKVYPKS